MTSEHPNLPTVAIVKGHLAVIGGGEGHHIASDGHDKVGNQVHTNCSLKSTVTFFSWRYLMAKTGSHFQF